jgi:hypothetical protein
MRAVKVITKEKDGYKTQLINLDKVRNVVCEYPKDEEEPIEGATQDITQDIESAISEQNGQKITFEFESGTDVEINLEDTPAKFIIYDDYGDEFEKTGDLEEVETAIIAIMSNVDVDATTPSADRVPGFSEL